MPNYKFEVRLENMNFSDAQVAFFNKELEKLLLTNLVKSGVSDKPIGEKFTVSNGWSGKWLRQFASDAAIKESNSFRKLNLNEAV